MNVNRQGKIIAIYNPCERIRTGCSTTAIALATTLSWYGHRKTFLTSYCLNNQLCEYIKSDITILHTLDDLRVKGVEVKPSDQKMLESAINDKLTCIGNQILATNINTSDSNFLYQFIRNLRQENDFSIIDLGHIQEQTILDEADIIICLIPYDEDLVRTVKENNCYFTRTNTLIVFNNVYKQLLDEVKTFANSINLTKYMCLTGDVNIYYNTTISKSLYSYLVENIRSKDRYINDLLDLSYEVLKTCDMDLDMEMKESFLKKIFRTG